MPIRIPKDRQPLKLCMAAEDEAGNRTPPVEQLLAGLQVFAEGVVNGARLREGRAGGRLSGGQPGVAAVAIGTLGGGAGFIMEDMTQLHLSDAEVAKDFTSVLKVIRQGVEVIVEQDSRPVAVIRPLKRSGRSISECIASAKASGSVVTLDGGFAEDVEEGIKDRQQPWNPPSWD